MAKSSFETALLEAIDKGLESLGESVKQAIYFHLEKGFNIPKQEIPNNIETFAAAVEKIFGMGANFLETLILQELREKTGLKDKDSCKGKFAEAVTAIKRKLEQ